MFTYNSHTSGIPTDVLLSARTESSNIEPYLDMYARARRRSRNRGASAQGCTQIAFQSDSSASENTRCDRCTCTDDSKLIEPEIKAPLIT